MQRYKPQLAVLALCIASIASPARAQSTPQQLAETNRQAMEAFTNLDVEAARATLEKAIRAAEKAGIRGPALARTFSNLAVVLVAGAGEKEASIQAFERALKEDASVEPDPLVATPEVMAAYNAAKGRGKAAEPAKAPSKRGAPRAPVEGNLDHAPAPEQLSQTAVPVFVKKSPELGIASIKLSYRSLGMKKPKTVDLTETDDGYSYLIPCTDVFEPVVEYFMVAVDGSGRTVGNAGTAANPIAVPVVRERSQPAPSLPGQLPPTQCSADDECPPGMPGCRSGNAGMGDTCSSDSECQSGLICEDDFCVSGERGADDDDDRSESVGKRFFIDVNFGVAATSVGEGRAPDRAPQALVTSIAETFMEDLDEAEEALRKGGFDCETALDEKPGQVTGLRASNCAVAVDPGGFVAVPLIYVAAGYYVTPRVAVAVTGRFQLARGRGPLAGTLLGLRGEYLLTQPAEKGFRAGLLAGFSVGQMQARPKARDPNASEGPYATNANIDKLGAAIHVGGKVGYRFLPNLGLNLTPTLGFGLPNLLFAIDVTGGLELAF